MSSQGSKIKTAVIPAAGLATRFLPVTKSVMKGLIPVLDTPMIQYIVEEAVSAGMNDIIFVTSPGQTALEEYFSPSPVLERTLQNRGKADLAEKIRKVGSLCRVRTAIQDKPLGLGHAVLCAEKFVLGPFAVLLPDEILMARTPAIQQLVEKMESLGGNKSCVGVVEVPRAEVFRYGVVAGRARKDGGWDVERVVEKPTPDAAPSNWVLPGRYVFTQKIFEALRASPASEGREWQLTDGIETLAKSEGVVAVPLEGERFDTGNPIGHLDTILAVALARPDTAQAARALVKKYGSRI